MTCAVENLPWDFSLYNKCLHVLGKLLFHLMLVLLKFLWGNQKIYSKQKIPGIVLIGNGNIKEKIQIFFLYFFSITFRMESGILLQKRACYSFSKAKVLSLYKISESFLTLFLLEGKSSCKATSSIILRERAGICLLDKTYVLWESWIWLRTLTYIISLFGSRKTRCPPLLKWGIWLNEITRSLLCVLSFPFFSILTRILHKPLF